MPHFCRIADGSRPRSETAAETAAETVIAKVYAWVSIGIWKSLEGYGIMK